MSNITAQGGLDSMRRITELFIAQSPTEIALVPRNKTSSLGGVYNSVPGTAKDPQTFRIIEVNRFFDTGNVIGEGATIKDWDYILVGSWDADVDLYDSWTENGIVYRVMSIQPSNNYRTHAYVNASAVKPENG